MDYLPPSPDQSSLYSLLNIVSDPKATKARLDEIAKSTAALNKTVSDAGTLAEKAEKDRKIAEETLQKAIDERKAYEESVLVNQAKIDEKIQLVNSREVELSDITAKAKKDKENLDLRIREVTDLEKELAARESALTKRENDLSVAQVEYNEKSKDLDNRLKQLRQLAS